MTNMCLNNPTAGKGYLPLGAGIALIATSLINLQSIPEKKVSLLQKIHMPFFEKHLDSSLTNVYGTGGIVAGKYTETPRETLEGFISTMVNNSMDSPREFEEVFRKNCMNLLA